MCANPISDVGVFLIHIPDTLQRIPAAGGIGISQIQQQHIIAALLQELGVQGKQLALGVRHNHGAAAICCT